MRVRVCRDILYSIKATCCASCTSGSIPRLHLGSVWPALATSRSTSQHVWHRSRSMCFHGLHPLSLSKSKEAVLDVSLQHVNLSEAPHTARPIFLHSYLKAMAFTQIARWRFIKRSLANGDSAPPSPTSPVSPTSPSSLSSPPPPSSEVNGHRQSSVSSITIRGGGNKEAHDENSVVLLTGMCGRR